MPQMLIARIRHAYHPGIVNILVATAPLVGSLPHSVLLTSLIASVQALHLYKDTEAFYKKLLCMTPQAAALLIGMHRTFTRNSSPLPMS